AFSPWPFHALIIRALISGVSWAENEEYRRVAPEHSYAPRPQRCGGGNLPVPDWAQRQRPAQRRPPGQWPRLIPIKAGVGSGRVRYSNLRFRALLQADSRTFPDQLPLGL